jgi:hypothetical protein
MAAKRKVVVAAPAVIEDVDVESNITTQSALETGIIILTSFALIVGIVLGLMELGKHYGAGPMAG